MGFGSTTDKGDPKDNILPDVLKEPRELAHPELDAKTLDELRGVAKDMQEGYRNLHEAKLSLNEKATVEGLHQAVDIVKQQIEMQAEQMNRLIGMYQTLQGEFTQRVIELQSWLANGGSTTPEDNDGSNN